MAKKITSYQEDLIESLKDPREAAAYLNAAMEEDDRAVFPLALRNVAEAHGGMTSVAEKARLNRTVRRNPRPLGRGQEAQMQIPPNILESVNGWIGESEREGRFYPLPPGERKG